MSQDNDNRVFEIVAIAALLFLLWRAFGQRLKASLGEPATTAPEYADQFKGDPMNCQNIIYKPLMSSMEPVGATFLGRGWCQKGDGSFFDGKETTYGDKYADEQAQAWNEQKQEEAVRNINRKYVHFRLVNTGEEPITTKAFDVTQDNTVFDPAPSVPVASAASGVTASGFTANWSSSSNTTGYYLDVATDSGFTSYVSGFENKDVGNVTEYDVTGLSESTPYYYRIRAYNSSATSTSSDTIETVTGASYADWFLPSRDELSAMSTELAQEGVGGFADELYWSSSEDSATQGLGIYMHLGSAVGYAKGTIVNMYVRACRYFTSTDAYSVRDTGPAGGLIFIVTDLGGGLYGYYEAAPSDTSSGYRWSNITNIAIGTTATAVGEGQDNTNEIIGQAGHTASAAKLCDDLVITV